MRRMKKQFSILAIMAAILLAALAASPVSANNGQGEVIAVTGVIPGQDLMVHVIALVPSGANRNDVANAALAAQGARAITAEEYSTIGLLWDQFSDSNPGNDFVDQYYNPANEPSGVSVAQLKASQAAWNDVAASAFVFNNAGNTNRCPSLVKECRGKQKFDGWNDVGWLDIKDPNTLGVTWSGTSTDEADMVLDTGHSWATDNVTNYDVQTVLTHEEGHALGLGHSGVVGAIMEAIYAGPRRGLHADDIAGVSALYPSGPPPPAAALVSIAVTPTSASVAVGATQQFTATGTYDDSSSADVTASVDWVSDNPAAAIIDGSGVASGVAEGSAGISASQGAIGSNSATLTVTAAPPPPPPPPAGSEVGATGVEHNFSGGKDGNKDLRVVVSVANDLGAAVEGAAVDITLQNVTSGASWTGSASTGADGTVAFRLRNAPAGCYSTDVDGISAAGLTWDGNTGPFPGATCKSGSSGNRADSGALQTD